MDVDCYLSRIGAHRSDDLHTLQEKHLLSVPFENLSIHLDEPIVLTADALFDKIVNRRRGGFCYELNGLFALLLTELGHSVTLVCARPFNSDGVAGPPFDHLALLVDGWLVDVGFGRFTRRPLRWDSRIDQQDPDGVFRLVDTEDGDVDVLCDGKPQYRVETRSRGLKDFVPTCWWHQTSPDSHFTRSSTCSLPTADGRVTLSGTRLIHTVDGRRSEEILAGDQAVLAAYQEYFGIVLKSPPAPVG